MSSRSWQLDALENVICEPDLARCQTNTLVCREHDGTAFRTDVVVGRGVMVFQIDVEIP
jgi:hypothetical protein